MDIRELLWDFVVGLQKDDEHGWCIVIPEAIFAHIVEHLIPRNEDEED